jgi:hypothetical protein
MCGLGVQAVSRFRRKPPVIECRRLSARWRREKYESEGVWEREK